MTQVNDEHPATSQYPSTPITKPIVKHSVFRKISSIEKIKANNFHGQSIFSEKYKNPELSPDLYQPKNKSSQAKTR